MEAPELAIVIVNYNTRDEVVACVRSVLLTTTVPLEIVVVDNGSADGSVAALREFGAPVTVVEAGANLGFATGVNRGAEHSHARWVLLLNPDTIVLDGAIDSLVSFADAHPEYGVYGGRTLRPDGSTDPRSCWGAMTLWSIASFALGLTTIFKRSRLFDPESLGRWNRDTVREVPIVTGCLLLISRDDWQRLGGMDERFFLYGEDAEFSLRAHKKGLRPVIVPDATIIHAVGGSTAPGGRKMSLVMAGKATLLRTQWRPLPAAIGIALLQCGVGIRAAPHALRRKEGTWTHAWAHRRDWRAGYPAAVSRLFDDQHSPQNHEGARP